MGTLLDDIIGRHGHQADLAVLFGDEQDHAAAQLLLELVAQVAELVHVDILDCGRQELDAVDHLDLVHDIAQSALGLFVPEGFVLALEGLQLFLQLFDMVCQGSGVGLEQGRRAVELVLQIVVVGLYIGACDGFNTSDTGSDAVLGDDLELADLAGIANVGTAAELYGIRHFDHADFFAVFLAEQRHGAGLSGFVDAHDLGLYRIRAGNTVIDFILDSPDLITGHGLEVAEVEPGPVSVLIGALLLNMAAQNVPEGLLQQVGRAVVAAGLHTVGFVDPEGDGIADLEHALCHGTDMGDLGTGHMLGLSDREFTFVGNDHADIADLAALGAVERCVICDNSAFLAVCQGIADLAVRCHIGDLRLLFQSVITVEAGIYGSVHLVIYGGVSAAHAGLLPGALGLFALFLLGRVEAVQIDPEALLLQDFLGGLDGEAVGIVQTESVGAVQDGLALSLHLLFQVGQDGKALVDGPGKFLFLTGEVLQDEFALGLQLGIAALGAFNDSFGQFGHEVAFNAQFSAVADGPADNSAQDIASAFIGGHDTIGDHESSGTDMVGHDTHGYVGVIVIAVFLACHLADLIAQSADGINVKNRINVLYGDRQTLQSHTGIDILLDQLGVVAVAVVIELGEYDVPYFHVSVAFAAYCTVRLAAAVFLAAVKVDLGTGAAGA